MGLSQDYKQTVMALKLMLLLHQGRETNMSPHLLLREPSAQGTLAEHMGCCIAPTALHAVALSACRAKPVIPLTMIFMNKT